MSPGQYRTSAPSWRKASKASETCSSGRMPLIARSNPLRARCSAQPKPMPRLPPVINATGFISSFQFRNIEPAALFPTLEAEFGQLDAFGPFQQCPRERLIKYDMAQEHFPLYLERIVML